jgi:hypothetical protein
VPSDPLQVARRARRRLTGAGWLLVAGGVLLAATADLLAPVLFPFGLAAGALTMLAGRQLARLRSPLAALLGSGATLVGACGAAVAWLGGSPAGWLAPALAASMTLVGSVVLAVLFADASHLPAGPLDG